MSWVLFSILAALIWAIANTVDKYIITKWLREPATPVMFLGIIGLIMAAVIFFIKGVPILSYFNILLVFIAGTFYILHNVYYFKAFKIEEISRVVPIFYLSPLFVLLLSTIFLNEIFSPKIYFGIFLLVSGTVLISIKRTHKITITKSLGFILISAIFWAIYLVITKYLLSFADYWTIFAYVRVGTIIALIPLVYLYLPGFIESIKQHGKKVAVVITANEILNITGVFFILVASSVGYVSLVGALSSLHPFFVLFIAVFLSIFYPNILKEEISKSTVLIKFIAIALIFAGAILIT